MKRLTLTVPATSANLGPGFDLLGLALPLYNRLTVEEAEALEIRHTGPEAAGLPEGPEHLSYQAAKRVCEKLGKPVPTWKMTMDVQIPPSRGLGSSSAAIVAGLVAANGWYGEPLSKGELLALANEIEGHPDNVAPAIYGGVTAAFTVEGTTHCVPLAEKVPATLVLAVPAFKLATEEARRALPETYSRQDVVMNLAAVTILTTVMSTGKIEYWPLGLIDRIHQPYRLPLIPGASAVFASAKEAGAYGCVISGAGPTLLAITPADRARAVAEAMEAAWDRAGIQGRSLTFEALSDGARLDS